MKRPRIAHHYLVDAYNGWFVVHTYTKALARAIGKREMGHDMVRSVSIAHDDWIREYRRAKGYAPDATLPIEESA